MAWKGLKEDILEELGTFTVDPALHKQGLHLVAEDDKESRANYYRWYHKQVWYPKNKEKKNLYGKEWREKNRDLHNEMNRKWYAANREKKLEYQRNYQRKPEAPETVRERSKRWYYKSRQNPEKLAKMRESARLRSLAYRARKRQKLGKESTGSSG